MPNRDPVTVVNPSIIGVGPRRYNGGGRGLNFRQMFRIKPSTVPTKGRRPSTIVEEEGDDDDEYMTKAERIMKSLLSTDDDDSDYNMLPMSSEFLVSAGLTGRATAVDTPNSSLKSCLDLLSSSDLDQNRVGLQRLMLLTKGRALPSGLYESEELASFVLVYGGELGSIEDRLRYVFATMICDAPHDDTQMLDQGAFELDESDDDDDDNFHDDDSTNPYVDDETRDENEYDQEDKDTNLLTGIEDSRSWDDSSSDEDDSGEEGKAWGALHNHALKILTSALTQVVNSSSVEKKIAPLPLHDTIWKNIIRTMVKNIVNHSNADTTGYSLKVIRMVYSIHPEMTLPLLRHTLFPHLVYLSDYGESHRFPMIHTEAAYLLKQATSRVTS